MKGLTVETYSCDNDAESDPYPNLMPLRVQLDYGHNHVPTRVYRLYQEDDIFYITLNGAKQVVAAIEAMEKEDAS